MKITTFAYAKRPANEAEVAAGEAKRVGSFVCSATYATGLYTARIHTPK